MAGFRNWSRSRLRSFVQLGVGMISWLVGDPGTRLGVRPWYHDDPMSTVVAAELRIKGRLGSTWTGTSRDGNWAHVPDFSFFLRGLHLLADTLGLIVRPSSTTRSATNIAGATISIQRGDRPALVPNAKLQATRNREKNTRPMAGIEPNTAPPTWQLPSDHSTDQQAW